MYPETIDIVATRQKPMGRLIIQYILFGLLLFSSLSCSLVSSAFSANDDNPMVPADQQGQPDLANPQDEQDGGNPNQGGVDEPGLIAEPEQEEIIGKLPGIWVSDTDTGYGTIMHTELALEYTGTFSQTVTAGSLMTWDVGTYVVGDGFIRFVVENHEPKEYLGQAMSWATGFTYFYTFVDENTIIFEDRLIDTAWYAYRQ